jgi:hypothetical protein
MLQCGLEDALAHLRAHARQRLIGLFHLVCAIAQGFAGFDQFIAAPGKLDGDLRPPFFFSDRVVFE